MSSLDERRAGFQRYKEDVKKRGKPFYPFAMFHDTVMSLVVVCVIAGLAVVWKYTDDILGPLIGAEGRPGDDHRSSRGPTGTSTSSSTCCGSSSGRRR